MINIKALGVESINSLDYVSSVFEAYSKNEPVVLLKDGVSYEGIEVIRQILPARRFGWMRYEHTLPCSENLAQISFTSGTEGSPKGVLLSHAALADVSERLNDVMCVDASIREYIGVPVNYSFGLGRCRAVVSAGGMCFLPSGGFNPIEIRDMLIADQINAISAVPSLFRVLLRGAEIFGREALKVKWIEIGSQYMSGEDKLQLRALFPNACIVQHYGLTEASRSTLLRIDNAAGDVLESVGKVYGKTQVRIDTDGCILIKGPHTAHALMRDGVLEDCLDTEGWLKTNDRGHLKEGFLYFEGRSDDVINCGGVKLSPDLIEEDLRKEFKHIEFAVSRIPDEMLGEAVLVAYKVSDRVISSEAIINVTSEILKKYGVFGKSSYHAFEVKNFPETSTGKVQRRNLPALHAESLLNSSHVEDRRSPTKESLTTVNFVLTPTEKLVADIWGEVLECEVTRSDVNFYQIGGDSLSSLTAIIELEKRGCDQRIAQGLMQGLSIREIAQSIDCVDGKVYQSDPRSSVDARASKGINAVRGLLACIVVFAHWSAGLFERLPSDLDFLQVLLGPVLAIGTPGFAVIYGVSVGYSLFPIFQSNPERFFNVRNNSVRLLLGGVLLLGIVRLVEFNASGLNITLTVFTNQFYSVLTFYFLATVSIAWWFRALHATANPALTAFLFGLISYSIHYYIAQPLGGLKTEGIVEFIKLLFTAKYAYFNMFTGVFWGISAGLFFRDSQHSFQLNKVIMLGASCIVMAVIVASHGGSGYEWWTWPVSTNPIWRWMLYASVVTILIAFVFVRLQYYRSFSNFAKNTVNTFSVFGLLSFPLFILHELVLPIKNSLLHHLHLSNAVAIMVALGLFAVSMGFLFKKMFRVVSI